MKTKARMRISTFQLFRFTFLFSRVCVILAVSWVWITMKMCFLSFHRLITIIFTSIIATLNKFHWILGHYDICFALRRQIDSSSSHNNWKSHVIEIHASYETLKRMNLPRDFTAYLSVRRDSCMSKGVKDRRWRGQWNFRIGNFTSPSFLLKLHENVGIFVFREPPECSEHRQHRHHTQANPCFPKSERRRW